MKNKLQVYAYAPGWLLHVLWTASSSSMPSPGAIGGAAFAVEGREARWFTFSENCFQVGDERSFLQEFLRSDAL